MSFAVYHNPHDVKIGDVLLSNVQSIVVSVRYHEIRADDTCDPNISVPVRYGRTAGAITLLEPVSAAAVAGLTGTLSFKWKDVKGATDKTVTIANCSMGGYESPVKFPVIASSATISFVAEAAPEIGGAE